MFLERAAQNWWVLLVRGILTILFGVLTVMLPATAVLVLVILFGAYAIADGVASLSMLRRPTAEGGWLIGVSGVLSIAAGVIAFVWPGITAIALFYLIAAWAIVIGLIELFAAIAYSHELENEWAVVLSGLLWVGFGVLLFAWPNIGVATVLALIAAAAILRGLVELFIAFRLRGVYHRLGSSGSAGI
jgi:uncharacterized membrane protein HdeD (DUF308 family)